MSQFIHSNLILVLLLFTIFFVKDVHAAGSVVKIVNNKLTVDEQPFLVRGIHYNATAIGTGQFDKTSPQYDMPRYAAVGANTVGTFNLGKIVWQNVVYGSSSSYDFYNSLYPAAEKYNLKIIIGYYANESVDWTNTSIVATITSQYQELVQLAKDHPSTLMYTLGDEVFERMTSDVQKVAYAKWIGQMVDWTHQNEPNHPVAYSEGTGFHGSPYLNQYAPNLDIYLYNNYSFTTAQELTTYLNSVQQKWPGKPILLFGWGSDSFDANTQQEDQSAQAQRDESLATIIDGAINNGLLLGSIYWEWNDEWKDSNHDPRDEGWYAKSCFDTVPNAEYWGLTGGVAVGAAVNRPLKQVYYTLQKHWVSNTPTFTPTPTRVPTNTPTSTPIPTPTPTVVRLTNTPTPSPLCSTHAKGDANCDTQVDLIDFEVWRQEYTGQVVTKKADFNTDALVDLLDFQIWRTSYLM